MSGVCLQVLDAFVLEELGAVAEELDGFEEGVGEDGHHGVELEVASCGCPREGGVVADDAGAGLEEALTDDGIDLAGHDGAAWLARRHSEFSESASGAACHPAQVVRDLGEGDGEGFEMATDFHECVPGGLGFDMVAGFCPREVGEAREFRDGTRGKVGVAVDASSHGGTSEGQFAKCPECAADAQASELDLACEGCENLAEADGGGVHEMGAPEFEDGMELGGFLQEA